MADSFRVRIDMKTLRSNLSRAEGRDMPEQEVIAWLGSIGFAQAGTDWICEELTLDALDKSEILSLEPIA